MSVAISICAYALRFAISACTHAISSISPLLPTVPPHCTHTTYTDIEYRDSPTRPPRSSPYLILYVHWWDYTASVEEAMNSLHALVMQGKVLYLVNIILRVHHSSTFSPILRSI